MIYEHPFLQNILYTALIGLIFYAFVIRDSRRDEERRMRKVMAIPLGDRVSIGGVVGIIVERGTYRKPFVIDIGQDGSTFLIHAELRHLSVPMTTE